MPENLIALQNGHEQMKRTYSGNKKIDPPFSVSLINCMNIRDLLSTVHWVPHMNWTLQNVKWQCWLVYFEQNVQIEWLLTWPHLWIHSSFGELVLKLFIALSRFYGSNIEVCIVHCYVMLLLIIKWPMTGW